MNDEPEVGLVESHAQRRGGDKRLDTVGEQVGFQLFALGGFGGTGVGGDHVALLAQVRGDVVGLGDREGVDDAGARQRIQMCANPCRPLGGVPHLHNGQPQRFTVQTATQYQGVSASDTQLAGDIPDHTVVGGRRCRQNRDFRAEFGDERADAPVVGAEVVAPIRHTVCLVDDDESGVGGEGRQDVVAEVGVVEPFRTDQQHVQVAVVDPAVDVVPVGNVARS